MIEFEWNDDFGKAEVGAYRIEVLCIRTQNYHLYLCRDDQDLVFQRCGADNDQDAERQAVRLAFAFLHQEQEKLQKAAAICGAYILQLKEGE